ncbi:MAG TPA: leucyl aminopeptidase family protein [Hyphomicrobiaceae bacterium]|nr:leucyl aminopeptidase family protein [Hyphomicrobiaceae bacterium]
MTTREKSWPQSPADIIIDGATKRQTRPIWLVREGREGDVLPALSGEQRAWLKSHGFKGTARRFLLLPSPEGGIAGAVLGIGPPQAGKGEPIALLAGLLPTLLPPGGYHLETDLGADAELAATAYGLGAYRFRRYKSAEADPLAVLKTPRGVNRENVLSAIEAVWIGRDLINTPANDMGPAELEAAARDLARRHDAQASVIIGDDLLARNFPLIHTVGRASPRAPRLIELTWGRADAPRVTLVGKGICFDTGGLDIKPSASMLLMKKDMGGAASVLALAHMIMARRLDVRLRIVIAAAENSVAGNAFRPGDVLKSRGGRTVEIGNTDAEGRLVLADALALADEDTPDVLMTFATLTGAARVALGPDLPPVFCDDDATATALAAAGEAVGDPMWRLPMTTPYESWLDSPVADMNNVAEGGFAGSIVGAMFLKRFVKRAKRFAHFDIYGWRPAAKPIGPKGGEPQGARAVFEWLKRTHGRTV